MLEKLNRSWRELTNATAGSRFEERYRQMKGRGSPLTRALKMAAAVALILVGLIMLFVPGPGLLAILAGAALIGEQSRTVARWLDRADVGMRQIVARAVRIWHRFRPGR